MRVIAGKYKRRVLKSVKSMNTRPTTDKNRESLFNMIGPYFQGGIVLDLFAGSGALGIEAMSRGADYLYSVDVNYQAISTIKDNIHQLKIDDVQVLKMDYLKALSYFEKHQIKFDYVFLDPPYNKGISNKALTTLIEKKLLNQDAIIVVEEAKEIEFSDISDKVILYKHVVYGISALHIYKYEGD